MENAWSSFKNGLAAAAVRADELTRLARVRLDIAAVKSGIQRLQRELGILVHQQVGRGAQEELAHSDQVRQLSERIGQLEEELKLRETHLLELRATLAEPATPEETSGAPASPPVDPPSEQ